MCGISGAIGNIKKNEKYIYKMSNELVHRGPDLKLSVKIDKVIFNHLYELSGGKISLNSEKHVLSPSENLIRMSNKRFGKSARNNKHKKYRSQKQRWK